jgi:hypothetical protein
LRYILRIVFEHRLKMPLKRKQTEVVLRLHIGPSHPLKEKATLEWAKMPWSVITNRTLICVKLFCCTGMSMFVTIITILLYRHEHVCDYYYYSVVQA